MTRRVAGAVIALVVSTGAVAQTVSGQAFDDRNGNGRRDAGEPAIAGVAVEVYGTRDVGGAFDQTSATAADGSFALAPGNGCYLMRAADPAGWRGSFARFDMSIDTAPGYTFPIGYPRFAKSDQGIDALKTGNYVYTAMGDSISANFNLCGAPESFWYSKQVTSRLQCVAPGGGVTLDQAGVSGEHTDHLLIDDGDANNVFRVIALPTPPKLVTISMIGNDLRNVDITGVPSQAQINRAVDEVLDSRQNLQEAISVLTSQLPGADIALNTLYDNLAFNCYAADSSPFHRTWLPIVNRILRDLAWGQTRRASINEVAAEFAREDQNVACTGFDQMICAGPFNLDTIHPNNNGYTIVREKVWEGLGGVNLGPKDPIGRTSIAGTDFGFLKRIRRLLPTTTQTQNGAVAANSAAATSDADGGATASITLGRAAEEFRVAGFPDWYDEDQAVKVLAGVRYRTSGTVTDDFYRIEASPTGTFRAPAGYAYTTTNWNFYTPIVGGGGPNAPASNSDYMTEKILALPNVASLRDASATLTKNPVLGPGAGEYDWPALTHDDLATTAIRVVAAKVADTAGDAYQVELDAAWLDVYGWQKPRPGEVQALTIARQLGATLDLSFGALPSAQRYNLYIGRLATLRAGGYDHGASAPTAPLCAAPNTDAGGGRRNIALAPALQPGESAYFLVTAHVDDVESPTGTRSGGVEIDRAQSICK
jgi:lysophospholipase L1-like esterase